jgi:hypothetical protein
MNQRIVGLITLYVGIILIFALLKPEELDWTPTFDSQESAPFASEILYQRLPDIRSELVRVTNRPAYNTLADMPGDNSR